MKSGIRHRSHWGSTPRRGTKKNEIFLALLEGVASDVGTRRWGSSFASAVNTLRDMCGFDIRSFKDTSRKSNDITGKGSRHPMVHKIVGRQKWDGGYVSFVKPEDYV